GALRPHGRDRQEGDGHLYTRFREPVDGGRIRSVSLDGRTRAALLRIRDFTVELRVADYHSESRRQISRLASLALRRRTEDSQGHLGNRRHPQVRSRDYRLEG